MIAAVTIGWAGVTVRLREAVRRLVTHATAAVHRDKKLGHRYGEIFDESVFESEENKGRRGNLYPPGMAALYLDLGLAHTHVKL